jgi:hypothetical protein
MLDVKKKNETSRSLVLTRCHGFCDVPVVCKNEDEEKKIEVIILHSFVLFFH